MDVVRRRQWRVIFRRAYLVSDVLGNLFYHELQLMVATAETRFGARVLGIEDRNAACHT